jgi:hypothetical protein
MIRTISPEQPYMKKLFIRLFALAAAITAVEDYSREVVAYLRDTGLRGHLYAVGNEIDFAISGFSR